MKAVLDIPDLTKKLRAGGFPTASVIVHEGANPNLYVQHQEAEGDPTAFINAYTNPDWLEAVSNKPLSTLGIPEAMADGADRHMVTVRRMDGTTRQPKNSGSEQLKITGHFPLTVSPSPAVLANGQVVIAFGPATMVGEWDFTISDASGNIAPVAIHLGFAQ